MKRREFIAGLGGAAAWPLGAQAQRPGKPQTIGYLGESQQGSFKRLNAAFLGRLHELGWIEGRNSVGFLVGNGRRGPRVMRGAE